MRKIRTTGGGVRAERARRAARIFDPPAACAGCGKVAAPDRKLNALDRALGDACKILFPIPERIYFGNPESRVAVCTLSSIRLLRAASRSSLMRHAAVVGRLFSENKGIDEMVRFLNRHAGIEAVLVCGRETRGHAAGEALILLHRNGIDREGRIIGSESPDPVLTITREEAEIFRERTRVVDRRGETDLGTITALARSLDGQ